LALPRLAQVLLAVPVGLPASAQKLPRPLVIPGLQGHHLLKCALLALFCFFVA